MNYSNWRSRLQNSAYVTNAILAVTILVFLLETFSGGSTNNSVLVFLRRAAESFDFVWSVVAIDDTSICPHRLNAHSG